MADDALAEQAAVIHDAVRLLTPRGSVHVAIDVELADEQVSTVRIASSDPPGGAPPEIGDASYRLGQLATALEATRVMLRRRGIAWTPRLVEVVRLTKGTAIKGTAVRFFSAGDRPVQTLEVPLDDRFALVNEHLFDAVDDAARALEGRDAELRRALHGTRGARLEADGSAVTFELADGSRRAYPLRVVAARASDTGLFTWSWASRSLPPSATTDVRDACRALARLDLRAFDRPSFVCEPAFAEALAKVVVAKMGADTTYRVPISPTMTFTLALSAH